MCKVELRALFKIEYGNQLDLNKLRFDKSGVNFVSRSSKNLGVSAKVRKLEGIEPYQKGLITVTLGGTYLLSSFVQQGAFYTAQNIKVLKPKIEMNDHVKMFYCYAISANRFRYTSHGREANKTLDYIKVPSIDDIPKWVNHVDLHQFEGAEKPSINAVIPILNTANWKWFELQSLFNIERGKGPRKQDLDGTGNIPVVTSTDQNNGWTGFTSSKPVHKGNSIGVNRNGSVGEAFYQPLPFCSTEDVHVFDPKFPLNKYIGLFLTTIIKQEKYRFNYGRKWGIERMKESKIKLPVDSLGNPNWEFMENYIKSLPFSSQV